MSRITQEAWCMAIRFAILLAVVLSTAMPADAQIVQVVCDTTTTRQICENGYCRRITTPQRLTGSGTILAAGDQYKPGQSLVLSCSHVLEGDNPRVTVSGFGSRVIGHEYQIGPDGLPITDLSLLEVDSDFADLGAGYSLPLADDDDLTPGETARAVGWTAGNAAGVPGVVQTSQTMLAQVRQGDSGGPVMFRGRVRGVIHGYCVGRPQCAVFVPLPTIRRFVERFRCGRYVYRERSRVVMADVAPPPPGDEQPQQRITPQPITPTPIQPKPLAPTDAQVSAAVNAWLTAHASELRGPQGERGPVGATGIGAPGLAATDAQIAKSVETWIMANRKKLLIDVSIAWKDGTPVATFEGVPAGAKVKVLLDKTMADAKQ